MVIRAPVVKHWLRVVYRVLEEAVDAYGQKGDAVLGAAIAFYVMLSAAPLLVIAVGVAGLVFGRAEARDELMRHLRTVMGEDSAAMLWELMHQAREPLTGGVAAALGAGIIAFAATRLFVNLQRTLNVVMGVRERITKGIRSSVRSVAKQRLQSFVMVIACGVALTVLVIARLVLGAVGDLVEPIAALSWFWGALELLLSFALFTVILAVIYKVMPDVYLAWRDVWLGASITAVLLAVGILPISWYLGRFGTTSAYGAAGTLVAILLFTYYAAQIFFFGAEITAAWARRCGSGIRPKPHAVAVGEQSSI
jgi:membrane protein